MSKLPSSPRERTSAFGDHHPLIGFLFYGYVITVTAFFRHPVLLGISLVAALAYSTYLKGRRAVLFNLGFVFPFMVVAALFNPLFSHEGLTILFYFAENPITQESIVFGLAAAVMLGAVLVWFSAFNAQITADKIVYLFGRITPALSTIIALTLRLVPRYQDHILKIAAARRGLGLAVTGGNWFQRVRSGLAILSIQVTWSLENAVETSDSMRARGYGLPGRSAYSLYRFDARDQGLLIVWAGLMILVTVAIAKQILSIRFFPSVALNRLVPLTGAIYLAQAVICFSPLVIDLRADWQWRRLRRRRLDPKARAQRPGLVREAPDLVWEETDALS
jgi:energy-coupling factor transport system permease protein